MLLTLQILQQFAVFVFSDADAIQPQALDDRYDADADDLHGDAYEHMFQVQ